MWIGRILRFYFERRKRLFALVGKESGRLLLKAIHRGQTIMVIEKNTDNPIDGELYNILKGLGAKAVQNSNIVLENNGSIFGTYITFLNVKKAY